MEETSLTDFLEADETEAEVEDSMPETGEVDAEGEDSTPETGAEPDEDTGRSETEAGSVRAGADRAAGPPSVDADAVEPAETTAAWAPASDSGGTCETCGEPADWRWRDEGALVCEDCKRW